MCGPAGGGPYLEFIRVPEDKAREEPGPPRVARSRGTDLDGEIERLVGLGASIAWEEEFPPEVAGTYRNVVLRDPEGNEFCLGAGSLPF